MTHAELQAAVIELANALGVAVIVAAGRASTPGATDLVLVGRAGIAFVELKSQDGRRSLAQIAFGHRVDSTGMASHYTWRPSDLDGGHVQSLLDRLQASY